MRASYLVRFERRQWRGRDPAVSRPVPAILDFHACSDAEQYARQSVACFNSFDTAGGDGADEFDEEVEPVERSIFINLIREPQVERLIGLDQQFKRTPPAICGVTDIRQ